jgi:hypothetical protein
MNSMVKNVAKIFEIKERVARRDPELFHHTVINNTAHEPTVSIVMTASNRSSQTYFTLETISKSSVPGIHVVIVDDSDADPLEVDELRKYPLLIDFIQIRRENKCWHNPLVNYNIGFQFIRAQKIVIQNAEVCHVGDVLYIVNSDLQDGQYFVFDCAATNSYDANDKLYADGTTVYPSTIERKFLFRAWYQSRSINNQFHFLTAITRRSFDSVGGGFPYDCTFGSAFDDNDLLLKIKCSCIEVINKFHDICGACGIHLYHGISLQGWDGKAENNWPIFYFKERQYKECSTYLEFTEDIKTFESKINSLPDPST